MPYISRTYLKLSEHAIQTPSYVRGRNTGVTKWPLPCIRVSLASGSLLAYHLSMRKDLRGRSSEGEGRPSVEGVRCDVLHDEQRAE